jgi:hypothetical protein
VNETEEKAPLENQDDTFKQRLGGFLLSMESFFLGRRNNKPSLIWLNFLLFLF